ncbi:cAMP-dependent protein kinase catalytic subunit-like [Drosophila nasuta]|uniref:cAMP-dependent protein kinase catalytic subunit-like n=1 Tax=Drosophila nasuta TaxID=42062 RepID=UPI00295EB4E7|nr:cAMP-dependent protein kinase catalytic subunit-like [Drosophila nasuta]
MLQQQQQQQPLSSYQQPQQYQAFPAARQQQYQAWQQPQQQYAPRQQQQQQQQQQYQYHQPEQHLQLQSYPTQQQLAMQPVFAYDGRGCYTPAGYTLTPMLAATTTAASEVSDGQCVYYQYADEDYVNSVNYYDQSTGDMCAMGLVYVAYKDNNSNYDGAQSYALTEQSNRSHRQRGMRQRTLLQQQQQQQKGSEECGSNISWRAERPSPLPPQSQSTTERSSSEFQLRFPTTTTAILIANSR